MFIFSINGYTATADVIITSLLRHSLPCFIASMCGVRCASMPACPETKWLQQNAEATTPAFVTLQPHRLVSGRRGTAFGSSTFIYILLWRTASKIFADACTKKEKKESETERDAMFTDPSCCWDPAAACLCCFTQEGTPPCFNLC